MAQQVRTRLAGAAGFEPANAGTKNRCLTTWRRPSAPASAGKRRLIPCASPKGSRAIAWHWAAVRRLIEARLPLSDEAVSLRRQAARACRWGESNDETDRVPSRDGA